MSSSNKVLIPLVATSVAVAATLHVLRPTLKKLASLLSLQWKLAAKREKAGDDSSKAVVSALYIYPVKSLRAVSVQEAELDAKGFIGDRRLMVVYPLPLPPGKEKFDPEDSTYRVLTQRQCPSLARVVATSENDRIALKFDKITIEVSLEEQSWPKKSYRAGIWNDQVTVDDLGDEAASFFQTIIDCDKNASAAGESYQGVRLVIHNVSDRRVPAAFTPPAATSWFGAKSPPVSLADEFPILIACQASLDELNRRLEKNGNKPTIEMSRFRPNIVINNTAAFEEDRWKYIAIGDQLFAVVKACPRCKQSCTDQETGEVHTEPVETLKTFRALNNESKCDVFFAQNLVPLGRSGTIRVGDTVHILERGDPVYC